MITYLIKSGNYYKIGRTKDLEYRLKQYDTHNPEFELIHTIECDCETYLHHLFDSKRYKKDKDWFILSDIDIEFIKSNTNLLYDNSYKSWVEQGLVINTRKISYKGIMQELEVQKKNKQKLNEAILLLNNLDLGIEK